MSVVGPDFERLKRFNLAEIYEATPETKPETTTKIKNAEAKVDSVDG